VEGRITGAVFVGTGSWELRPASEVERRHLALLAGDPRLEVLSDAFESLVLIFTDATEADIRKSGTDGTVDADRCARAWEAYRRAERRSLKVNVEIRVLEDVLGDGDVRGGFFAAMLPGRKVPQAVAVVDSGNLDWLAPGMATGNEGSALYVVPESDAGFWYLARRPSDAATRVVREAFAAEHYDIETRIADNTRLSGTTVIRFQALRSGRRVVRLHLTDRLRILEAAAADADGDTWEPMPVIQEKVDEDSESAVVLPVAAIPGEPRRLRVRYEGRDVLNNRGDGVYAVGARESWYPNLGSFQVPATFALTYRVPRGNDVISVGTRVEDRADGELQLSTWKADRPIRVAGFNYGRFRRVEKDDPDSGVKIEVYTNPGTPDVVREINAALQSRSSQSGGSAPPARPEVENYWGTPAGLQGLQLDTAAFADGAMADGLNAARVGTAYFGPLQERHVAITQQAEWFFGQSWPSLVFLPYLSVLDGTQRQELGLGGATDFVDLVGPHELAHQWWGHLVGWNSYHDVWLSEGFAEFTASLVLQRASGAARANAFWERARRAILEKPRTGTVLNADAGPISLGVRLATRPTPLAYDILVYEKGAYVLHMLRMLMWDPKSRPPDAAFIAMMKDFAASFADKNPSTRDFQTVVERHMTPTMDLTHDRKMDWFFRQWIDGTEIPRYAVKLDVRPAAGDQYTISGTVAQSGVSADFRGFLPVYLEYEKGEFQRLAVLTFTGAETVPLETTLRLPRKPRRVVANVLHDVLTGD
jgi:hypothetical protein